jgi:AcrR family transcriptional regulator
VTRTAEKTRARILEAAHTLFAVSGTAAVSTNHVAASARISPGNLYYHFANKEEIVAALVDRLTARVEEAWDGDDSVDLGRFEAAVERSLSALAEFSFLARELFALALHMPSVAERERRLRQARIAVLETALESLIDPRKLRDDSAVNAHRLAELAWLVGFVAIAEAELAGETGARAARRATLATMTLIAPYLA